MPDGSLRTDDTQIEVRATDPGAKEAAKSFTERLAEIRTVFKAAFWVANFSELFERLAYYATSAVLAIYLSEQLHFPKELTGWIMGIFGCVVWSLPVLGGTLADRFGFRRARCSRIL